MGEININSKSVNKNTPMYPSKSKPSMLSNPIMSPFAQLEEDTEKESKQEEEAKKQNDEAKRLEEEAKKKVEEQRQEEEKRQPTVHSISS